MPELIGLYEDHVVDRDQFVILAIHVHGAQSFAELDPKLVKIRKQFWKGKDLPFPVLIDGAEETKRRFGIRWAPTGLLIDPTGKLVGPAEWYDLEEKLPTLPLAVRWARQRNMYRNMGWDFERGRYTLQSLADLFKEQTRCDVEVDKAAAEACGLLRYGPLPGMLVGSRVTLRSIEELLLAPLGLGIQPSADGQKLLITRRVQSTEPESYFQKLHGEALAKRLDGESPPDEQVSVKPLEVRDQPLQDVVKRFGPELGLPVALDAVAIRDDRLDPAAKVSGHIDPKHLRQSLNAMLQPLGLTVRVRNEVVLITLSEQETKKSTGE